MKRAGALLLGAALMLALGTVASAQVGLDLHGLYGFNFNDDEGSGDTFGSNADNTFGGGASLVFCLGEYVRLDLGADYLKPKDKDDSDVKMQLIPITGTLRVGAPIEDVAFIYVGGGGGYSFNDLDVKGVDDEPDMEGCATFHACGGGELLFNENIGIRAEFRYVWLKPEIKDTDVKIKFDHMQVRGGLVFYF